MESRVGRVLCVCCCWSIGLHLLTGLTDNHAADAEVDVVVVDVEGRANGAPSAAVGSYFYLSRDRSETGLVALHLEPSHGLILKNGSMDWHWPCACRRSDVLGADLESRVDTTRSARPCGCADLMF